MSGLVSTSRPYWRTQSLDRFNGHQWLPSVQTAGAAPPRFDPSVDTIVHQHVVLDRFGQPYLPSAYVPVRVVASREPIGIQRGGEVVLPLGGTYRGFTYDVQSVVVSPSWADLDGLDSFQRRPGSTPEPQLGRL